ncbi:hypothetical protein OS493_010539 [Desmophyllum pertusum]|uniref:Uncharacterized protein n=1 Tax=Desmophyllum pertusum TaxID=174260 RepID=A0A9X0DBP4_9CNID|nr:hypothetical protein OS493_010539 [Desmophyllum pertusum]
MKPEDSIVFLRSDCETLLDHESLHRPLQNPLRSADGYSYEEQSIERHQALPDTESQPSGNVVPNVEIKPARPEKQVETKPVTSKKGTKSGEEGARSDKEGTKSGEKEAEAKEKENKVLDFKKFDIPELDCIFTDFKTTFDPFVENRKEMSKAEDSFKKAVMSIKQISPHAKFSEYVDALKTRLKTGGITVKVKEGALAIFNEGKKTVQGISDAVAAVNAILKLAKELKAMPMAIVTGSEDTVERADELDVQGILKQEFKSVWDFGKIPKLKKAFSNNVQQVKRAPGMVREFYRKTKEIILEIYHAFADEEDLKKMGEELAEEDDASKDERKQTIRELEGRLVKVLRRKGKRKETPLRRTSLRKRRTKTIFTRSLSSFHWDLMTSTTCSLPSQPRLIHSWKRASAYKTRGNPSRTS